MFMSLSELKINTFSDILKYSQYLPVLDAVRDFEYSLDNNVSVIGDYNAKFNMSMLLFYKLNLLIRLGYNNIESINNESIFTILYNKNKLLLILAIPASYNTNTLFKFMRLEDAERFLSYEENVETLQTFFKNHI